MGGEHYSKQPRPEENSGTYAGSPPSPVWSAVRLLAEERCHNHPGDIVVCELRRKLINRQIGHCVEDVRKGYVEGKPRLSSRVFAGV